MSCTIDARKKIKCEMPPKREMLQYERKLEMRSTI